MVASNSPHPLYLTWVREHQPELLQVIDQPIHTDELLRNTYAVGLYLEKLESYSLFSTAYDYQWIILKQRRVPTQVQGKSKVDLKLQDLSSKWL